jgi:hypothetical protein
VPLAVLTWFDGDVDVRPDRAVDAADGPGPWWQDLGGLRGRGSLGSADSAGHYASRSHARDTFAVDVPADHAGLPFAETRWVGDVGKAVAPRRWHSGRLWVMQRGSVGDADDQAVVGQQPGHRLSPRLCAGWVQELKSRALKLATCRCDCFLVRHLELD